jgi:hypothetical protein
MAANRFNAVHSSAPEQCQVLAFQSCSFPRTLGALIHNKQYGTPAIALVQNALTS